MDAGGNILVADPGNGGTAAPTIWKMTRDGSGNYGAPVPVFSGSPFVYIESVAVDSSGNLWVADYGCHFDPYTPCATHTGNVFKLAYNSLTSTYGTPVAIPLQGSGWGSPLGIVSDSSGNIFVSDNANSVIGEVAFGGSFASALPGAVASPLGIALDSTNNLYAVNGSTGTIWKLTAASNYATVSQVSLLQFSTPVGTAVDAQGNIFVTNIGDSSVKELTAASGFNSIQTVGGGVQYPEQAFFDGNGDLITGDVGGNGSILKIGVNLDSVDFGLVAIGSSSSSVGFQFTFTGGGATTLSQNAAVLTEGSPSPSEFVSVSGCSAGTFSSGSSCTVQVVFNPAHAGIRRGAVQLITSTGVVASARIYGTGLGPELIYSQPGQARTLATVASPYPAGDVNGIAINAAGEIYVVDTNGGKVLKISGGVVSQVAPGIVWGNPKGLAIDGGGNLFVTDDTNNTVKEVLSVNGTIPATPSVLSLGNGFVFLQPSGIALDRYGNVYLADSGALAVREILASSGYTNVQTLGSGLPSIPISPQALAVDSAGNIYLASNQGSKVWEWVATNGKIAPTTAPVIIPGNFMTPDGIAVDSAGNLFVNDAGQGRIDKISPDGKFTVLGPGNPGLGITVDASGNVYFGEYSSGVVTEFDYSTAPSLTFPATIDGTSAAESVTILNNGNDTATPLTAVSPGLTITSTPASSFTLGGAAGDCTTTFSLLPGQSCNISVTFMPLIPASGAATGTVTLTDNNRNSSPSTTQQISLSGTAVNAIGITSPGALVSAVYGSSYSVGPFTATPSSTYTWSATGLPLGLTMSSSGTISGTPTQSGVFSNVVVTATDTISSSSGSATYTLTVDNATSSVTAWPTASAITYGQTLTNSTLTGGTSTPAGTFAFTAPSTSPNAGTAAQSATFTPTDTTNYTTVVGSVSVTVNKASATVTFGSLNQTFTGSPIAAAFTTNPTGLTVSITYNGSSTAPINVGSYAVLATVNESNFLGTASGNMVIAKATAAIAWNPSATISYGTNLAASLTATAAASGNSVAGTFIYTAQPSGGSTSAVTAATVLPAGSYTLAAAFSPTDTSNYVAAFTSAPLTVSPAPLTATADNATRVYGTANPSFTGNVTGAANGDTFVESFTTTATAASNAGTYNVSPSVAGANLANYSVTVQNGALTVTQAGTTVALTTSSGSITPGQSITLTATVASNTTGTPTGLVDFLDGATVIGSGTLSGGAASLTTTSLSTGTTHQITARYNGDINFHSNSTTQSTQVVVVALDFTFTIPESTKTVTAGSSATYSLSMNPLYGSYPAAVTFTATGLPVGTTAQFSPTQLAVNSGQQTVTMTISTPLSAQNTAPAFPEKLRHAQPFALAFLLFLGIGGMRKHGRSLRNILCLMILILGSAATLLTGCGGSASNSNTTTPVPKTYNITVTASSASLQHTASVTLNVQ
jgi:sugar lactone lactonase YvrE